MRGLWGVFACAGGEGEAEQGNKACGASKSTRVKLNTPCYSHGTFEKPTFLGSHDEMGRSTAHFPARAPKIFMGVVSSVRGKGFPIDRFLLSL